MATVTRDKATGRVIIRAYAGTDKRTGKRRKLYDSLPHDATDEQVAAAVEELDNRASMVKRLGCSMDVEGVLSRYLSSIESMGYSPATVQSYRSMVRCYIAPYIGAASVDDLHPWVFTELFGEVASEGGKDGGPVSPNTVRKLYAFLHSAFARLADEGIVQANPVDGAQKPKPEHIEAIALSEFDWQRLEKWACDEPDDWDGKLLRRAIRIDLATGARRGEVCGWRLCDWSASMQDLRVAQAITEVGGLHAKAPKSKTSKRHISIDDDTARLIAAHLREQSGVLEEAGSVETSEGPLLAHSDGTPIRPSELTLGFGAAKIALGIDSRAHFHSLRHTHATYLLQKGVDIRTLQERLGHYSPAITLGIYGHVLPGRDRAAADAFAVVSKGINN